MIVEVIEPMMKYSYHTLGFSQTSIKLSLPNLLPLYNSKRSHHINVTWNKRATVVSTKIHTYVNIYFTGMQDRHMKHGTET